MGRVETCVSLVLGGDTLQKRLVHVNRQHSLSSLCLSSVSCGVELRPDSPKQCSGFDLQGLGELHDCHEGQISLTSLNCPHERNVQPRQVCQSFLRQFLLQAELPHTFPEGGHNDSHKCGHRFAYETYAAEGWFPGTVRASQFFQLDLNLGCTLGNTVICNSCSLYPFFATDTICGPIGSCTLPGDATRPSI
jgi:hypothetical protein